MQRIIPAILSFAIAMPALAGEVLFRSRDMSLPEAFLCAGTRMPAGRYEVEAHYQPLPQEGSTLTIRKGSGTPCVYIGARSLVHASMVTSKLRVFTRVDAKAGAIQIDVILPDRARSRIPNQVFYLPLADSP